MQFDYWQIARIACNILFSLWPFVLLGGLLNWRGKFTGLLAGLFAAWFFLAISRVVIAFDAKPLQRLIIPEPVSTLAFLGTGAAIGLVFLGMRFWRRRQA